MAAPKELQEIVAARAQHPDRSAALVTVVKTSGSTYRKPGARMLVNADGGSVGSISGGCLEDDAREHAVAAIASGQPALVRYDTTSDGDIVFGSGLGCQGIVHVLVEPLPSPGTSARDPLACVERALADRRAGVLASVFAVDPPGQPALGACLWFGEITGPGAGSERPAGHDLGIDLATLSGDAREVRRRGRPSTRTYRGRTARRWKCLLDVIRPPRALLVCGAGDDARPLVRLGKEMGWRVRVVDARRAYATPARFPGVDELVVCPAAEFAARATVEPGEAAVLMTHHFPARQKLPRRAARLAGGLHRRAGSAPAHGAPLERAGKASRAGRVGQAFAAAGARPGGAGHRGGRAGADRAGHRGGDRGPSMPAGAGESCVCAARRCTKRPRRAVSLFRCSLQGEGRSWQGDIPRHYPLAG